MSPNVTTFPLCVFVPTFVAFSVSVCIPGLTYLRFDYGRFGIIPSPQIDWSVSARPIPLSFDRHNALARL